MPPPTEQQHAANSLEWKSPLTLKDIVKYPDPRLREKNATIKVFGDRLQHLADELFDVMYKYGSYIPPFAMCAGHCRESVLVGPLDGHIRQYRPFLSTHQPTFIALCRDDGVGLAAPQVGLNLRLMVFNPAGERGKGEELILANPRIVSSTGLELDQEGCLSFKLPGGDMINGDVERAVSIRIKAQNVHGKTQRLKLEGFTARIFQHEYDHLEGTLFPDRMQLDDLERERAKLERMEAEFRKGNPGVAIQSCLARLA